MEVAGEASVPQPVPPADVPMVGPGQGAALRIPDEEVPVEIYTAPMFARPASYVPLPPPLPANARWPGEDYMATVLKGSRASSVPVDSEGLRVSPHAAASQRTSRKRQRDLDGQYCFMKAAREQALGRASTARRLAPLLRECTGHDSCLQELRCEELRSLGRLRDRSRPRVASLLMRASALRLRLSPPTCSHQCPADMWKWLLWGRCG